MNADTLMEVIEKGEGVKGVCSGTIARRAGRRDGGAAANSA